MEPTPITTDEAPAFVTALRAAFHADVHPHDLERFVPRLAPERSLAIRDRGRIVGTAAAFARRLAVPGGDAPVAAVTMVGVQPTHRRRGLLTALMRRQLDDVRAAGREALTALWASEGAIYGRFGYGLAAMTGALAVRTREARLRRAPDLRPELRDPAGAHAAMAPVHEAARADRPGMLDRTPSWWELRTMDPEHRRDGAHALRAAVIDGRGYALYAVKERFGDAGPDAEVVVHEVLAADPEAHAALWDYLLGLDLVRQLCWDLAPADDPLVHMVTEPQAVHMRLHEALWVRLVDVARALAGRAYAAPVDVVLEVGDPFCPWNAGRWRLASDGGAATCERTNAPADLELGAEELGAAYLGGTTLTALALAGRVRELRPGALLPASCAFRSDRAPWCPEVF